MANDGQIVFEVTADGKHAIANIKDITAAIQKETKNWDTAAKQATGGIEAAFSGMLKKLVAGFSAVKIGKMLLDIGQDAIQAASDLQEVQNVVDVTFGESAGVINDWAKNAITQYGLTETQAKRFASTMGAMLKSSGLAGDEINKVSTDMAGLAADMASFYNMDFDTAFQKIRSGLSGETEPLKQLGINMSVANLEAFALSKGITKAFSDMSQGEQVMLRYQYLMQATADAQGDFARTTDGYANGMRLLESNIESLKTKLGEVLLPVINDVVGALNEMLEKLNPTKEKTVLDQFNDIDADTTKKLAEIEKTADACNALIDKLDVIGGSGADKVIEGFATGANKLNASAPATWVALLNAFKNTAGIDIFADDRIPQNVEDFASALAGQSDLMSKAEAWQLFFNALGTNVDAIAAMTGQTAGEAATWLTTMASAAGELSPDDAESWNKFLSTFVGAIDTSNPQGQKFIESLATQYLALGKDSDIAKQGLRDLGFSEEEIANKQKEWLKTCKDLTQTIPGLSEIVNTETGEIKGGTGALSQYVEEWRASQEKLLYWKQFYKKKEAQQEAEGNLYALEIEAGGARKAVEREQKKLDALRQRGIGNDNYELIVKVSATGGQGILTAEEQEWNDAVRNLGTARGKAADAEKKYNDAVQDNIKAVEKLSDEEAYLKDRFGEVAQEETKAAEAAGEWADETKTAAQEIVKAATEATKALADYYEKARDSTRKGIDSALDGFKEVDTSAHKVEKLNGELKKTKLTKEEINKINAKIADEKDLYTITQMQKGMRSQINYLQKYNEYMKKAQEMGFSNEFLAQFADGSVESYNWLEELTTNGAPYVAELNAQYAELEQNKEKLTGTLTDQKLTIDQVYQQMKEDAREAVAALDMQELAAENTGKTVSGMAQGIAEHVPEVKEQVDALLAELGRLTGWGMSLNLPTFGDTGGPQLSFNAFKPSMGKGFNSQASGLDNVPYDGFLAKLHQSEAVLDAEEAKVWRNFRAGQYGFDYDRLGSTMHDSVKAGGNVYLNGKIVGSVISEQQGRSYKSLQRSGWQA